MDITQLPAFVIVAAKGKLTRAAELLRVAQSACQPAHQIPVEQLESAIIYTHKNYKMLTDDERKLS